MDKEEIIELKERISKLEKKGNSNLWIQFLVFPLIIAAMGYYFQSIIRQSEERLEKLKMTKDIVEGIFTDTTYGKTVALKGILDEILVNQELSKKIGAIIDVRLKNIILTGTVEQLGSVVNAVEIYSTKNDSLKDLLVSSPAIQSRMSKYKNAITKERSAFMFLINNELYNAQKAFEEVDSIFPTFHQSYEISRYLEMNRANFNNSDQISEIKKSIIRNYKWGAPKDLLDKLERQMK